MWVIGRGGKKKDEKQFISSIDMQIKHCYCFSKSFHFMVEFNFIITLSAKIDYNEHRLYEQIQNFQN